MNQYTEISGNVRKDAGKSGFQGASYAKLTKSVILGTITGVFSSVALMIIFALVINTAFGDPDGVIDIFTCAAAAIGAATGGFCASKTNGSKGFVSGIATGVSISIVILAVMVFSGKNPAAGSANSNMIFRPVIILCQIIFACSGGIFAVNAHKGKKTVRTYPIGKINKNK